MDYILGKIFGDTAAKHGIGVALLVVAAFAGIAIAAYYAKARIDLYRSEAASAAQERAMREQVVLREQAARDQEKLALIANIDSARKQNLSIVEDFFRRLDAQTHAILDVAGQCREQAGLLAAHAQESTRHFEEASGRLHQIELRCAEHRS